MVYSIADNITSPLGMTTRENLEAVRQGRSALALHRLWDVPEPFMASLFPDGIFPEKNFETVALASIREALSQVPSLDVSDPRVGLVLSSTKGNTTSSVNSMNETVEGRTFSESAAMIASALGITTKPIVVSNACISGLSAQIIAARMIESGQYDTVIVCGCDIVSKFIVAGFQSFKSISQSECRPFDEDRNGLNLGEAAATVVYAGRKDRFCNSLSLWTLEKSAIRNDAFHISGPSQTAEGSFRALRIVMEGENPDDLALINAHGTATLYNDDMESIAIQRADLLSVPVNSLKGYFGHTLGAAGVLETILTMHSIAEGWIIGTRGFAVGGTYYDLNIKAEHVPTDRTSFVKLMSGFGGCNAAALFKMSKIEEC